RTQVVRGAGEPDERVVAAGRGVDALRVGRGRTVQDLHLGPGDADGLRVGAADRPPGALRRRRRPDLLLPEVDDAGHVLAELGVEGLDLRRVADEIDGHLRPHPVDLASSAARPARNMAMYSS